MKNTNKKKHEEYRILRDRLSGFLSQTVTQVQGKILERTADKAEKRGVKGIKSFNLDVDWMTSNFVNLSLYFIIKKPPAFTGGCVSH